LRLPSVVTLLRAEVAVIGSRHANFSSVATLVSRLNKQRADGFGTIQSQTLSQLSTQQSPRAESPRLYRSNGKFESFCCLPRAQLIKVPQLNHPPQNGLEFSNRRTQHFAELSRLAQLLRGYGGVVGFNGHVLIFFNFAFFHGHMAQAPLPEQHQRIIDRDARKPGGKT
jgi:hypothetical protein